MAGAPFSLAGQDGPIQSLTTVFFLGGVDIARAEAVSHQDLVSELKAANRHGQYHLPREDGSVHRTAYPGVMQANMVRVPDIDPTDPDQLTRAEIEGRKQSTEYFRFLHDRVPGFENAFLLATSHHIGVRESRRILGAYVLTEDDVVEGRQFPDQIGLCAAPVEDHRADRKTRWRYVGGPGYYGIPYRTLVPQSVQWMLVAGRCFSATHGAQASARNSAQAMLMGEAAGLAAALSLQTQVAPDNLDLPVLRDALRSQGAILDEPVIDVGRE
jgi:hypothetical protein